MLSKDDLWECLSEYPEAKALLIEKGRQMLRKDDLLDEQVAREQDLQAETLEQRVQRLDTSLDTLYTRFSRLSADYHSVQLKLKQRITKLEKGGDVTLCNASASPPPPPPPPPPLQLSVPGGAGAVVGAAGDRRHTLAAIGVSQTKRGGGGGGGATTRMSLDSALPLVVPAPAVPAPAEAEVRAEVREEVREEPEAVAAGKAKQDGDE